MSKITLPPTACEARLDGHVLHAAISGDGVIRALDYAGDSDPRTRDALDRAFQELIGLPLAEAADHGAIRALHAQRGRGNARAVAGIALPVNAGPAYALAQALLRELRRRRGEAGPATDAPNEFVAPPTEAWSGLDSGARLARLKVATGAFLAERGLGAEAIAIAKLDRDLTGAEVRVDVGFADGIAAADKPALMRALERWLKQRVEDALQLYVQPVKDKNALRRL